MIKFFKFQLQTVFSSAVTIVLAIFATMLIEGSEDLKYGSLQMPNYRVDVDDDNVCTAMKLDPNVAYYLRSFEPYNPNGQVHHMLLNACEEPAQMDVEFWKCGTFRDDNGTKKFVQAICNPDRAETPLFVMANDSSGYTLPNGLSFHIGAGTVYKYISMQLHYPMKLAFDQDPNLFDTSGWIFSYQITPTPLLGGVTLMTASENNVIPPIDENPFPNKKYPVDTTCPKDVFQRDNTIALFNYRLHAHAAGRLISGFLVTDWEDPGRRLLRQLGVLKEKKWTLIGSKSPQEEQKFYDLPELIIAKPEDVFVSRCLYSNPSNESIVWGVAQYQEMCIMHMMYFIVPEQNQTSVNVQSRQQCECKTVATWHDYEYLIGPVPNWVHKLTLQL